MELVILAKAGIHFVLNRLDSRLRGNDDLWSFSVNSVSSVAKLN